MVTIDILQYKRKLVKPQIRIWGVDKKTGETFYNTFKGTKANLSQITQPKIKNLIKRKMGKEYEDEFLVGYKGKEYRAKEFLTKFPQFKLKRK
jgi:hypothetical protein